LLHHNLQFANINVAVFIKVSGKGFNNEQALRVEVIKAFPANYQNF